MGKEIEEKGAGDRSRDLSHTRQVSEPLHFGGGLANPKNLLPIYMRVNGLREQIDLRRID